MTSTTNRAEPERVRAAPERRFLCASALIFAASTTATVTWRATMAGMAEMPMPGGWALSMVWMPMCGQTWLGPAVSFFGMWTVMMVAMMLPSLVPMLRGYRQTVHAAGGDARLGALSALVGLGYFAVWTAVGMTAFAIGITLVALEMRWPSLARAAPGAAGIVVLGAGVLQCSAWKAYRLARCREAAGPVSALPPSALGALQHGLRLGLDCSGSCAGLTATLLVAGLMDLRAMVIITAAITLERVAPAGELVARAIGVVAGGVGLFLIARAAVFG